MTRPDDPSPPAIVIAAGGEGQRIGGNKHVRLLGGRPLLAHAIENAAAQSDCVAVAVREAGQIEAGSLPLLCDAAPGRGPISALASAFAFAAAQGRPEVLLIGRSEEHTSELQSLMRISYAGFCLKKNKLIYKKKQNDKSSDYMH